jgi:cytochrome c biogenesis protein CcdA/glutathione peroxidase-family protein
LLAGALTIGAPCILPMLPIILGASLGEANRFRPVFITAGFILAFTAAALVFGTASESLALDQNDLRMIAIALLALFGLLMIWRAPMHWVAARLAGVADRAGAFGGRAGAGNLGGLVLGASLGVVWTPCAGPVLASILTLIATTTDHDRAAVLLGAYAIGAGLPMLAIAYGGQWVTARVGLLARATNRLQQAFGVLILLTATAMHFEYDSLITLWLSELEDLRGKVVLVDFWTYSCINCVRTLPYVKAWHARYKDQGLVIIGVHTPEFAFERNTRNVEAALKRFGITYPVAQDNRYATWKAFENQYWPATYLIDKQGRVVKKHFGEGDYEETEAAIKALLAQPAAGS